MKIKRLLAMTLLLALLAFSLASCTRINATLKLNQAYPDGKTPYGMVTTIEFESENADVKAMFSAFDGMIMDTVIDGDNMMTITYTSQGQYSLTVTQTLVGNTLYVSQIITMSSDIVSMYQKKAELTDEERTEVAGDDGGRAGLAVSDFAEISMEERDGKEIFVLSEYDEDADSGLEEVVEPIFADTDATVTIEDLTMTCELEDGKLSREIVDCSYRIAIDGLEFVVKMTMTNLMDSEVVSGVSAPANADIYNEVSYDELMGN